MQGDETIPAAETGTELGGYRLESQIGRGGMGVVYRAHDLALDRKVALKLLAPELAADTGFRERFMRESRLAASLDHPSIVPIYDAGEVGGQLYIAMRLVEGTDLKGLLAAQEALPPDRTIEILGQVADALDAAHERGLVHRDVKPSNVLIDERGHCYLADFGLSRRLAEADSVGDGRSLGTIDYVAPEQIRGDELDGRADLYSLGCMLYECLAGRPPFSGSDTAVVFAHLQEEPPTLPSADPVIRKALAKEPDDRFQSGHALIAAARDALGIGRSRRSRALVAGAAALAAATAVAAVLVVRHGGAPVDPTADSLVRIDAAKNAVRATTPVGHRASAVAARGGYVWVGNAADRTVTRIDRSTGAVVQVAVKGRPTGVAAGPSTVIVASSSERHLTTIDSASGAVAATRTLAGRPLGAIQVAAGPTLTRFADPYPGVIADLREGVKNGVAVHRVAVPRDDSTFLSGYQAFGGLAIDDRWIWATGDTFGRSLFRIEPATEERVVETRALPFAPGSVAAGGGLVWVTAPLDDRVWTIDPSLVKARLVGGVAVPRGVVGLAYASGAVWVASSIDRVVSRIDPSTGRVVARIPTDGVPTAIAADGQDVWVTTTRPAPAVPDASVGIGILADCTGGGGSDYGASLAGAELPLLDRGARRAGPQARDGLTGAEIAGKPVQLAFGCTDGTALSAIAEARRLVEQVGVRILIGPSTPAEAIGLMQYARRRPDVTFVDGAAGAQMLSPPPNVFSFHPDLAASMAGLGTYAYRTLGWRRAVVVGELDDALAGWTQAAGFTAEFCALGGRITRRVWVPRAAPSLDRAVAGVFGAADGVFAAAGTQTILALYRVHGTRGRIGGQLITGITPGGFDARDPVVQAAPWLSTGRAGKAFASDLHRRFPELTLVSGQAAIPYHDAMSAVLGALSAVGGDTSDSATRLRSALRSVAVASPLGRLRTDAAGRPTGRTVVVRTPGDTVLRVVAGVEPTFGGYFAPGDAAPAPATPACRRHAPPRWAR